MLYYSATDQLKTDGIFRYEAGDDDSTITDSLGRLMYYSSMFGGNGSYPNEEDAKDIEEAEVYLRSLDTPINRFIAGFKRIVDASKDIS